MANQSCFRLLNTFGYRLNIICNYPRITLYNQNAGLKQDLKDRIKDLNIPERPKKPLTPFFRFLSEHRPVVKKKNPSLKLTEIVSQCAQDWANAHASIKEKYNIEYKKDLETFAEISNEYNSKLTSEQKDGIKELYDKKKSDKKNRVQRKRNKETGRPKRPIGPYMIYLLETAKNENKKLNELLQTHKGKWQLLTETERLKYNQQFEENKKLYEKEMQIWEAKMIGEGNLDVIRSTTKARNVPSRLRDANVVKLKDE